MEVAVMEYFDHRKNVIVPNVSWGMAYMHECDILSLTKAGYATEIEIKVSRADLLKDKTKKHGHNHRYLSYLYYAVPEHLEELALSEIPKRAGLLVVTKSNRWGFTVNLVRKATKVKNSHKWTDADRMKLLRLGNMRILGLKKKLL